MKRKLWNLLLCVSLIFSSIPMPVYAAEEGNANMVQESTSVSANDIIVDCVETVAGVGSVYDVMPRSITLFGFRENNTWDAQTCTYYAQLDANSKAVYDSVKSTFVNSVEGAASITLPVAISYNGTQEEATTVFRQEVADCVSYAMLALVYDEPEMSWLVNVAFSMSYSLMGNGADSWEVSSVTVTLDNTAANAAYTGTALETAVSTAKTAIDAALNQSSTNYDKLKEIHDYVCELVSYAQGDLTPDKYQTAHSALVEKVTVCAGYAKAFKILCEEYGIPCILVSGVGRDSNGNGEAHMWNYVLVDGAWYAVDCTWDDQISKIYYDYFLVGSDTVADNFGGTTFSYSHNPSGQWTNTLPGQFSYPALNAEKYDESAGSNEGEQEIVYVSGGRILNEAVTGSGTENDPYNDIETALQRVKAGGTIQIKGSITLPQPATDIPLNITKQVTITGGTLYNNYAGIVLGADVYFKDVTLKFNNSVRNAIIANGHTLTLENVKQVEPYEVDLFCGAITQSQSESPETGDNGEIIISGSNNALGDVYAGNFSDLAADTDVNPNPTVESHFAGNATITICEDAAGTIGSVYAYGAREDRQGTGNYNGMWTGNNVEDNFTVNGAISINLSDSFVKNVYGASDKKAYVACDSDALINCISFENIGTLESRGILEPASLNSDVNIKIATNAELILSDIIPDGSTFTVGDFAGGGMLVMGQTDKLKITGTITGTTEFQTDTINRPADKSTSGQVEYDYAYIDVSEAEGNGIFTFEPCSAQSGTTLTLIGDAWTTSSEPDLSDAGLTDFALADGAESTASMTVSEVNQTGFVIPVQYGVNDDNIYLFDIPLTIEITKDGILFEAVDPDPNDTVYEYKIEELGFEEIFLSDDDGVNGKIYFGGGLTGAIAAGTYQISITVPLVEQAEQTATVTYTLVVTDEAAPVIPDGTISTATPNGANGWYNELLLVAPDNYYIGLTEGVGTDVQTTILDGVYADGISYWLKPEDDALAASVEKRFSGSFKVDGTKPQITIAQAKEGTITHSSATIEVLATDATSGVPDTAEGYQLSYSGNVAGVSVSAFQPSNAGGSFDISGMQPNETYTFTLSVTDRAGNTLTDSTIQVTTDKVDILGAKVALKDSVSYTYDGTAKEPTAEQLILTLDGVDIPVNTTDFNISYSDNMNAGDSAKVTLTASGSNATYQGTATGTFAIAKRPLMIAANAQTISEGSAIQTGVSQVTIGGSNTSLATGEQLVAITVTADLSTNQIQPSAARIQNGADVDVTSNYEITYVVGNLKVVNPSISISAKDNIVYDGEKVRAGVVGADSDITYALTDCENVAIAWYSKADTTTPLQTAPIAAGIYIVKITAISTETGESVEARKEFEIKKATLVATVQGQEITYGANPATPGVLSGKVVYSGFVVDTDTVETVITGTPVYTTDYAQYDDVDGSYSIAADMSNVSASNYSITVLPGKLTVTPLPVTLSWSGHTNRRFGDETVVTASVANCVNQDAVQVTVIGGNETSVGSHTATATELTGAKAKNYTLTGVVTQQNYTIEKAVALTGIALDKWIGYNQKEGIISLSEFALPNVVQPKITAVSESTDDNDIISNVSYTEESITVTLASLTEENIDDTAQITVAVESDTHETITAMILVKIVDKAVVDNLISLTVKDVIYGEVPVPVVTFGGTKGENPIENYTYMREGDAEYKELNSLKNSSGYLPVGSYTVKYVYKDEGQIGTKTVAFNVSPKTITIRPAQTYEKTYGCEDPEIAYVANGLLNSDVLEGTFRRQEGEEAGSYAYDVTAIKNENYTVRLAEEAGKFSITPASATIRFDSDVTIQKAGGQVTLTVTAQSKNALQAEGTSQPKKVVLDGVLFTAKGNGVFEGIYTIPKNAMPGEKMKLVVSISDANYQDDITAELELTVEGPEKVVLPTPVELDEKNFKLEMENGVSLVPEELKKNSLLDTKEEIVEAMKAELEKQNGTISAEDRAVYDVALMYSENDGLTWNKADQSHWPTSGKITVILPYPEGTAKDTHKFTVVHMFTTTVGERKAGTFEYPEVTNTTEGICFQVSGLSPISLGWTEIKEEDTKPLPPAGGENKPANKPNSSHTTNTNQTTTSTTVTQTTMVSPKTGDNSGWTVSLLMTLLGVGTMIAFSITRKRIRK